MGIVNSTIGCFFSLSGAFPTLPNALSISISKSPWTSFSFFASGGVGSGGDFGSEFDLEDLLPPLPEFM
jgi:hypothetical protein